MKSALIATAIFLTATAQSAEIASIAFKRIEPVLKEYVLAKTQYSELKTKLEEAGSFDPASIMKTDDKGNFVLGKDQFQQASKMTSRFEVERSVRDAMRRELVLLFQNMDMKHTLVLNGDDDNALLYSHTNIEDITQKVYQELVKRLSENESQEEIISPNDTH